MQLRDNGLGFSPITIVLHWLIAALLLAIIVLAALLAAGADPVQHAALLRTRNALGLALFVVSIYRFWQRITSWHPLPVGTPNPIEVIVSRSVAAALALAMVLLPFAAWLANATAGEATPLPGGIDIPALFDANRTAHAVVAFLFNAGSIAFLAGLALHMFGALKNHFILRNEALKRMLGKRVEL
ncbi:cytochrome b [Burkholderia sp. 3C]